MLFFFVNIFMAIHFPFRYQRFKEAKKEEYLHAVCIVLGFFIPHITVLTPIAVFSLYFQRKYVTIQFYANVSVVSGGLGIPIFVYYHRMSF